MPWLALAFGPDLRQPCLCQRPALAQGSAAPVNPGPSTAMTPTPDDRAKQWLILVDDSNYEEAWKQAGAYLRDHAAADIFAKQVGDTRGPMGAMSSRTIKDVQADQDHYQGCGTANMLSCATDLDASPHKAASALETVALVSGEWWLVGDRLSYRLTAGGTFAACPVTIGNACGARQISALIRSDWVQRRAAILASSSEIYLRENNSL